MTRLPSNINLIWQQRKQATLPPQADCLTTSMKVTWKTSQRIHRTLDGVSTVCGHVFAGDSKTVEGELHWKKKRHCRTCFTEHQHFKADKLK